MWSIKVNICIAFGKTRLVSVQVWMEADQFEYVRGRTIKRNSSVMWNFVTKILSVVKTTRVTRAHFWMFSFQFFCFYPWIWQKDLTRTYYSGSKNAIIDRQTNITNILLIFSFKYRKCPRKFNADEIEKKIIFLSIFD